MIKIVLINLFALLGYLHLSIIAMALFAPLYLFWRFYG